MGQSDRKLSASVGQGGFNRHKDVRAIQQLINEHPPFPIRHLAVDGACGAMTIAAIMEVQKRYLHLAHPSGRVDPGSETFQYLRGRAVSKSLAQTMSVSQKGQDFIKGYEKLSLTTYDANPPHGDWTIGYGHKVQAGNYPAIVLSTAEKLFAEDISRMAAHVNTDLRVRVTQNEFDALVSLRFNAGPNVVTPPVTALNGRGHATKADFTKHYITAGGVKMRGLERRRAAEWRIFSEGVYDAKH